MFGRKPLLLLQLLLLLLFSRKKGDCYTPSPTCHLPGRLISISSWLLECCWRWHVMVRTQRAEHMTCRHDERGCADPDTPNDTAAAD